MQVNVTEIEPCRVALEVEVGADRVAETTARARKDLLRYVSVPGFRRGKAPESLALRYLKPQMIQEHALELLLPEAYRYALEHADVLPIAEPKVEVKETVEEGRPFSFRVIVPTIPKVKLGQYQGLEVPVPQVTVSDEDVDRYIERLRSERNALREVNRPVKEQDFVSLEVVDLPAEGEPGEPRTLRVVAGGPSGLDAAVVGKSKGEQFEVPPDEEASLPARRVTVKEIRAFEMPELDDAFAASVGNFATVEDLRAHVRRELENNAREIADEDVRRNLLQAIRRTTEVSYPREMLEAEVAERMSRFMKALEANHTTLDMHLRRHEKTLAQFEAEVEDAARETLINHLILEEIAYHEGFASRDDHDDVEDLDEPEAEELEAEDVEGEDVEAEEGEADTKKSWLQQTWDFLKENNRIVAVAPEAATEAP